MATIDTACDTCHLDIDTVFNPGTGTRASVAITGDVLTEGPCFVADEIRFVNHGRLIFKPRGGERNEGDYFQDYFVICRRLVIVGGHQAGTLNPCGPDDPGTEYEGNNVITWAHRLSAAASGPTPNPFTAAAVADFNRNVWDSSSPNGNHGANGHAGNTGNTGGVGGPGRAAPNFTLIALEVEIDGLASHLTIDWDGQNGGKGGRGQNGSNGGNGMGGRGGVSDTSWPGTGCDRQPGNGGSGGPGGGGGTGGSGGPGGKAGDITMLSVPANLTGVLVGGNISYVNDGGSGGDGGLGGFGGRGGFGGNRGTPTTSECEAASDGANGTEGWPPPSLAQGSTANQGSSGAHGAPGSPVKFDALVEGASCADLLPLRVSIDAPGLVPSHFCRGFSTLALGEGSLTGQFLAQVTGASTSLTGVTATKKASSTDTQLDLAFTIQGTSATGTGDLILKRAFGPDHVETGAISVGRFEVLSVAPNTGARGTTVNVTITGTCFDTTAALHNVSVSGLGVTVLNVVVLNDTTVQCVFDIANLAAVGPRHVTVQTGTMTHTLLNAFTIT